MKSKKFGLLSFMFLGLLSVHFLMGFPMPVKADLVIMKTTFKGSWLFDIDTGQNVEWENRSTADLWYEHNTETERYIKSWNGAEFANLGIVDFDSVVDCSVYSLSTNPINASVNNNTIPDGAVLAIRTNIGHYAKMRIDHYDIHLNVTIAYQDIPGSPIVPELPSYLVLPSFMIATLLAVIVYKKKTHCLTVFFR